jgi:hypothetical protein
LLFLAGTAPAQPVPGQPGVPAAAPAGLTFSFQKEAQALPPAAPTGVTFSFQKKAQALPPEVLPPGGIIPAALQPADRLGIRGPDEATGYRIQVEPPGPQRLFRLESEADLFQRIKQELQERTPPEKGIFPEEPVVSRQVYDPTSRMMTWPPQSAIVEPYYVCHGRLLLEQRNAERYGWDLGPFHPILSGAVFMADVLALPYNVGKAPCRCYECSAGLCLPGDPVPFLLYPPEWSATGLLTQAGVTVALFAVFP